MDRVGSQGSSLGLSGVSPQIYKFFKAFLSVLFYILDSILTVNGQLVSR